MGKYTEDEMLRINNLALQLVGEMKRCNDAGCYYAGVVLAGSVLEGILSTFITRVFDKSTENMKFEDIIDYAKSKMSPEWDVFAKKAHDVRKFRNNVHIDKMADYGVSDISKYVTKEKFLMIKNDTREVVHSILDYWDRHPELPR